jgi:hypothetical protein
MNWTQFYYFLAAFLYRAVLAGAPPAARAPGSFACHAQNDDTSRMFVLLHHTLQLPVVPMYLPGLFSELRVSCSPALLLAASVRHRRLQPP